MNKIPNIKVRCETGNLWGGYSNVSEMDEITATVLQKYGSIEIYLQFAPISMSEIQRYFINNVEVTLGEADIVWTCLQPRKDILMRGDFVDLNEVERILEKVCANNAI